MTGSGETHALVLSGGGARGAYEAGAIAGLWKNETFDVIVGTSIGALNAAFAAQSQVDELQALWRSIGSMGVVRPIPQIGHVERFLDAFEAFGKLPPVAKASHIPHLLLLWMQIGSKSALLGLLGVLERDPITAILSRYLDANALKRSLIVTASDLTASAPVAFYAFVGADANGREAAFIAGAHVETVAITPDNYVSAVEASAAIPGAFSPVQLNLGTASTRLFVDGGVANNTPLGLAIAAGATHVTVIFVAPESTAREARIANLLDIGFSSFGIMQQKILESDLKLARMTNEAVARDGSSPSPAALGGKREIQIRQIHPSRDLGVGTLGFDQQGLIDDAIDLGLADGTSPPPFTS